MAVRESASLEDLLEFIKTSRGFDFTGYKRSSIERRITKRMAEVERSTYSEYLDYLELHGGEFAELFNTLLINVTGFFRDSDTWEHLASEIVPQLVNTRTPGAPLRIWCPGVASGQEAYTVAMVFARVLGEAQFRGRVKIYATDVDELALDQARQGAYLPRQVEDVPPDALERFFEHTEQRYVLRKDLRQAVIFGRHDLVQDAPISRIDLLVCRNTLMYFTAETQAQILRRFHFALEDEGVLLLGKSEMLITHAELFTPVEMKWRVYRKVVKPALRDRVRILAHSEPADGVSMAGPATLRQSAFDLSSVPQVVLDADRTLVMVNAIARRLFGLGITDIGRPVQDLELSYRPVELRSHLDAIAGAQHAIDIPGVRWAVDDQERVLDVRLVPLLGDDAVLGTSITYQDVTASHQLRLEINTAQQELEEAYEELRSTVEELETTNEELQSTNEELETTNEELQSTNEELETTNEELQSSNEELETINDELRHRSLELNEMNAFLETILATIGVAVAVLDRHQHVQIWNGEARDMWGITVDEATDQHMLGLDIGLPMEELRPMLREMSQDGDGRIERVVEATNRRGRRFACRLVCLPLLAGADGKASGTVVMMEAREDQ
jgi:two-component system CheB/CheR fusion protein